MDEILQLRKRIDEIDDQILSALIERVEVCKAIGAAKKKRGLPIRDASREKEIYERIKEKASQMGPNASEIEALYREIVNICSAVQE